MALVMIIVELISALLAPAAEFAAPVFVLFGEVLFWVVLLVVELVIALIHWRRPGMPCKPQFSGMRGTLKSFSDNWRKKRADKEQRSKNS